MEYIDYALWSGMVAPRVWSKVLAWLHENSEHPASLAGDAPVCPKLDSTMEL